ncbi:pseudouridine synthase [Oceanibacterium hippocampi]|uniref:Pseudouridine synthase n=1 Tax=Oceanibacterium hippocampi TaxID=745714 RepID=A0A1Y5S7N4_9PROT|nr:pseudouridine synthase [Oceanibacterium hippocampi]SLN32977.1 Ribosomal large subunit pseudouridine synthase B [Oceanibacterium hippocampi]
MTKETSPEGERIAKRIARAGHCSRREAELLIADGRVSVDGKVIASPALNVGPSAKVTIDGQALAEPEPPRIWRYHKPDGLVTSNRDPQGRPTVFEKLPDNMPRVISVGRLDLTSEGLLLLTNDGELARRMELPATGWARRYRVRVHGMPDEAALKALEKGVTVDGVRYGGIQATLERQQGSNAWLSVTIREGKNREIRKVMQHLGLHVARLIRISYGPFQLGDLETGLVEEVPRRIVRDQLGLGSPNEAKHREEPKARRPHKGKPPHKGPRRKPEAAADDIPMDDKPWAAKRGKPAARPTGRLSVRPTGSAGGATGGARGGPAKPKRPGR